MGVTFTDNTCHDIINEMNTRVTSDQWSDPHNGGTYSITNQTDTYLAGQRVTGDQKYTDKFDFTFTTTDNGCQVEACSESQVNSMLDFSTNYCNLHDLYCNSADGCPTFNQFKYNEQYNSCSEHDSSVCVADSSKKLNSGDADSCSADVKAATADITAASLMIAKATTDCADGFTDACNTDIDAITQSLVDASADITAAVYDCSDSDDVDQSCADDINDIIADVADASLAFLDAMIDCPVDQTKCTADFMKVTGALTKAGFAIANATTDCA